MARPVKENIERRTIIVKVRLTISEKRLMAESSEIAGVSLSDLLRMRTLSTLPQRRKVAPETAALIRTLGELGKVGGNINQIAKHLNRQQQAGRSTMPYEIINDALDAIKRLSVHILNIIEHGDTWQQPGER